MRECVLDAMVECHERLATSQLNASGDDKRVYGLIWAYIHKDVASAVAGRFLAAQPIQLGGYRVMAMNGWVIVPWRVPNAGDPQTTQFATGSARGSFFSLADPEPLLPVGEVVTAEVAGPDALDDLVGAASAEDLRVLVVAMQSMPKAVHEVRWGWADLIEDGTLAFREEAVLLSGRPGSAPMRLDAPTFADGVPPRPAVAPRGEPETGSAGA
jgi:hypothetical protein